MKLKLRLAAITDEFSPDLERALNSMVDIGMTGAELRTVGGRNMVDFGDQELEGIRKLIDSKGLEVMSLSSPLLKCVLPGSPAIDSRFQQDVFGAVHTFEDQPRLTARAFHVAHVMGARIVRVFTFWRTVEPEKCFDGIVTALKDLADKAAKEDLIIGLENEHACNVGTASEAARVLNALDHPNLQLVWDPANCYAAGETPYPDGYRALDPKRIAHVHAKDCFLRNHQPVWGPVGECELDWRGQIAQLLADGYRGWMSLETHWPGTAGGDKHMASVICGHNLKMLLAA